MASDEDRMYFNGLNGETGAYLNSPLTPAQLKSIALGEKPDPAHVAELKTKVDSAGPNYGLIPGRDPKDLGQCGWGVIFAADEEPGVYESLKPLLDLRKQQAEAKGEPLYKEYRGENAYQVDETKPAFLKRFGSGGAGLVDPRRIPYYLLIVGDPESIPYRFQYQMDVQYAVGRIHFDGEGEDKLRQYATYAETVAKAEKGEIVRPRKAAFFGVGRDGDLSTTRSSQMLVEPLRAWAVGDQPSWSVTGIPPAEALVPRLTSLIGGADAPAFLFAASHGMGGPMTWKRQLSDTGALVCQEWPGPAWSGNPRPFYYAAENLSDDKCVAAMIAMFFACYGAGSPKMNEFRQKDNLAEADQIAPKAFVSALPKRMLSHPNGGALAVVGHVERAWDCSFRSGKNSPPQLQTFQSSLKLLMEGFPVGAAMEPFNTRYSELSTDLTEEIKDLAAGKRATDEFIESWTANNDARNYAVIGDPAVRMAVAIR